MRAAGEPKDSLSIPTSRIQTHSWPHQHYHQKGRRTRKKLKQQLKAKQSEMKTKLLRLNFSYTLCNGYILCLQCSRWRELWQKHRNINYIAWSRLGNTLCKVRESWSLEKTTNSSPHFLFMFFKYYIYIYFHSFAYLNNLFINYSYIPNFPYFLLKF